VEGIELPPGKLGGLELMVVAPPKNVYWRVMGQYTPRHVGEGGKTHVSHIRGYGGRVQFGGDLEVFELKMKLMGAIAAMADTPGQEGAVLAHLRETVAALSGA
jgi:hypothetical protein